MFDTIPLVKMLELQNSSCLRLEEDTGIDTQHGVFGGALGHVPIWLTFVM